MASFRLRRLHDLQACTVHRWPEGPLTATLMPLMGSAKPADPLAMGSILPRRSEQLNKPVALFFGSQQLADMRIFDWQQRGAKSSHHLMACAVLYLFSGARNSLQIALWSASLVQVTLGPHPCARSPWQISFRDPNHLWHIS